MRHSSKVALSALFVICGSLPAGAFKPYIHADITRESLVGISRSSGSDSLTFSAKAIAAIQKGNTDTDGIFTGLMDPVNHCDDELFGPSSQRLVNLKAEILTELNGDCPDGAKARQLLGTALHTLQDFYAHSNWVEMGSTGPHPDWGNSVLQEGVHYVGPDVQTNIDGDAGRLRLDLTLLTSGFFQIFTPDHKVRHGFILEGINKDEPSRPGHATARALAKLATDNFVNSVLDGITSEKGLKALMRTSGTLGVVIDTTGSMGDDIAAVQAQVANIISGVIGTDNEPGQYLSQEFNDPGVPGPVVTCESAEFLAAVNGLFPNGGGDCPELANTGLLKAIAASRPDSNLYLFSDATAKDTYLMNHVLAAALGKRIRISYFLTGSCSPIDPSYLKVANESGGQLFMLSRFAGDVNKVFELVEPQLPGNLESVRLTHTFMAGETASQQIPVDGSLKSLVVAVSGDSVSDLQLRRPDNSLVAEGDPGVTMTTVFSGRIIRVSDPAPGLWSATYTASGEVFFSAKGNSNMALHDFAFVSLQGRPEHEALMPIPGSPLAGSTQRVLAKVLGIDSVDEFIMFDEAGAELGSLSLVQGAPDASEKEYGGDLLPPTAAFRVGMRGVDAAGNAYLRVYPPLFKAQSVGLLVEGAGGQLSAGGVREIRFKVKNFGPSDTFEVEMADDQGFTVGASPNVVTLGTGEEVEITGTLFVPSSAVNGSSVLVTATATSTADPTVTNSMSATYTIVSGDAIPPVIATKADVHAFATSTLGAIVSFDPPEATDNLDGSLAVSCAPASGSQFPLGESIVACSATDTSGNEGTGEFKVVVTYDWSGFLPPISPDGSTVFRAGATVPIRFRLVGASADVHDADSVLSIARISAKVKGTVNAMGTNEKASSGNRATFEGTSRTYRYNWSTRGLAKGTYRIQLDLGDGVERSVLVSLK